MPDAAAAGNELTTILEGIGEGFYSLDREWRITRFNSAAARHFGRTAESVLGRVLWDIFPGARNTALGGVFVQAMETRQPVLAETPSVVISGRWLAYRLFPLGDGLGVVFRDVTDRKNAEAHRELLIHELNHRVKNMLTMVQAIAAQTLKNAGVAAPVTQALTARLAALSSINSVLTDDTWIGAELRDIVTASLRPHLAANDARFQIEGPSLRLRRKSAVIVSMALHELCTNAIKYGALSTEAGRVVVSWTSADGRMSLAWQECGGPAVKPPTRQGFGSRLIQRGLPAELRGRVRLSYPPSGVVCSMEAPLEHVLEEMG